MPTPPNTMSKNHAAMDDIAMTYTGNVVRTSHSSVVTPPVASHAYPADVIPFAASAMMHRDAYVIGAAASVENPLFNDVTGSSTNPRYA